MAARPAMHKDANLRKRNALVIPGGLLAVHGLFGIIYATALRTDDGTCGDASLMVFFGVCRSAVLVMAIPVVIGLALALVGAFTFRSRATCRHGHGSWTHFTLALLISLVVVPLAGIGLTPALLGEDAALVVDSVRYPWTSIFAGLAAVGAFMLVPFAFLYAGQVRANPCCTEKGCFSPCFCDEAPAEAPPEEHVPPPAAATPPADDEWKVVSPPPAAPPPPTEPSTPPTPPPPSEPVKTETATATVRAGAPPLASRPADPAAPPSDEMATAVEWAQEDEDDLEDDEPESAGKTARKRRATTKAAARPAKKAKSKKG